jgi:hypothetical protein
VSLEVLVAHEVTENELFLGAIVESVGLLQESFALLLLILKQFERGFPNNRMCSTIAP